jgi:DNA-directed RNA polymerase subunit RPC12/RpoP
MAMTNAINRCVHCDAPIIDPTTQVVHGAEIYCCPNCSAAIEESGSGSDPHALTHEGDLRCERCEVAIVDENTFVERDGHGYCCANCAAAAGVARAARGG